LKSDPQRDLIKGIPIPGVQQLFNSQTEKVLHTKKDARGDFEIP